MISLFLLIFAFRNDIVAGELTLEGLNGKMNHLESQVQNLKGEVKVGLLSLGRKAMIFSKYIRLPLISLCKQKIKNWNQFWS